MYYGEKRLDYRALKFWKLRYDPISFLPLQFERYEDFDLLVKTQGVTEIKDLEQQLVGQKTPHTPSIIVNGDRGSGKTTALKYFYHLLYDDPVHIKARDILPVFCGVGLEDSDAKAIRQSVLKWCKMPQKTQKSVTIPFWVWEKLVEHYKKHREEYESQGIRSPTRLVRTWILEKALKE